jgi:hypothetical protein
MERFCFKAVTYVLTAHRAHPRLRGRGRQSSLLLKTTPRTSRARNPNCMGASSLVVCLDPARSAYWRFPTRWLFLSKSRSWGLGGGGGAGGGDLAPGLLVAGCWLLGRRTISYKPNDQVDRVVALAAAGNNRWLQSLKSVEVTWRGRGFAGTREYLL